MKFFLRLKIEFQSREFLKKKFIVNKGILWTMKTINFGDTKRDIFVVS